MIAETRPVPIAMTSQSKAGIASASALSPPDRYLRARFAALVRWRGIKAARVEARFVEEALKQYALKKQAQKQAKKRKAAPERTAPAL